MVDDVVVVVVGVDVVVGFLLVHVIAVDPRNLPSKSKLDQ